MSTKRTDSTDAEFLDHLSACATMPEAYVSRLLDIRDRLRPLEAIEKAARALFSAEHYDHHAKHMSFGELDAIDAMKAAIALMDSIATEPAP